MMYGERDVREHPPLLAELIMAVGGAVLGVLRWWRGRNERTEA